MRYINLAHIYYISMGITITLLFKHIGSSRVSVGESSRPKGASLEQELIFRRHASSVRSQTGNMDDVVITVNGKHFNFFCKFNN